MTPEQARENLERLQIIEERKSSRRGYRGPSLGTENRMAGLQMRAEGVDFDSFESKKAADIAINERVLANREARGPMAFSTAEGRLIPWDPVTKTRRDQVPAASPLTQSPNLNFPKTEGGQLGMDYDTIREKARTEELRLAGQQPLGLTPQPTNFEQAGVKRESGGVIQTPYGIMSTPASVGQKEFEKRMARGGADRPESYALSPDGTFQRQFSGAEDRALAMAGMAEKGAAIRSRLEDESRNRYYAFRQGIAERQAQEALSTEGGRGPDVMRGAQAMIEAERMRQAQQGRSPMSREPLEVRGMQFRQTGMGQFAPIRGFGNTWATSFVSGGPQPMQAAQTTPSAPMADAQPSSFWQTVAQATPSITAPVQFPSAPMTGVMTGTPFASRIVQPEEDRLRGLTTAMGLASRGRARPMPFGLRGAI